MPTATKTKTPTKAVAKKAVAKRVAAPVPRGGRPRTYEGDRRQIQIRLPEDLRERLDDEANRRRVSKNYLIEQMIESQLPEWEQQDIAL